MLNIKWLEFVLKNKAFYESFHKTLNDFWGFSFKFNYFQRSFYFTFHDSRINFPQILIMFRRIWN